ncbi:MAG TPA: hypothetical protein VHE61_23175 [Opitutaceae bacterium]|nr:hypothetical protein [Opitutaceae bacterium]
MQTILGVLAALLILVGFVGFYFGMLPTFIVWVLAGFCLYGAWRLRPPSPPGPRITPRGR